MLTRLELLGSDDAAGDAVGVEIVLVRVVVVVEAPGDHGERWNYCRIADADVVRSGETGRGGGRGAGGDSGAGAGVVKEGKTKKESVGDCIGLSTRVMYSGSVTQRAGQPSSPAPTTGREVVIGCAGERALGGLGLMRDGEGRREFGGLGGCQFFVLVGN